MDAKLIMPEDFTEWVKTLHQPVRKKLSIHELRQIWDGSVREAYRFARPWLDAKGVYHRHDGLDFPSSDACPYCQIQSVIDERDQERTWREDLLSKTVPALEERVRGRDERIRELEAENARLREAGEKLLRMVEFELQDNAQESPWSGLLNRMHAALEDTDGQ